VVRVHFAPSDDERGPVRVAYSVGRKVGGAVVRNRWRRRLRAIAAEAAGELAPGAYLIGIGPDVRSLTFSELRERVLETMRRASRADR
jgi:ribonuclease P protein component